MNNDAQTQLLPFLRENRMNRNILIFQDNVQEHIIYNYINQSVDVGYHLTIVKIVPQHYQQQIYAYLTNDEWLKLILNKYHNIQKWHNEKHKNNHTILFNIELSQSNLQEFISIISQYRLPLFIDYFYTNSDNLNYESLLELKELVTRLDFNHLLCNYNTEKEEVINSVIKICDNYDIYDINHLEYLSKEFILKTIQNNNLLIKSNSINNTFTNNTSVNNIEEIEFKEILHNFHSATPIFIFEKEVLSLYLFGFKRFYSLNINVDQILSSNEFLQKTIIYLNKKMSKNFTCSDCSQRNYCFTQGLWLNHKPVENNNECSIYVLKKEL